MSSTAVATDVPVPAEVAKSDRFPSGVPFIVGNEGAERFSYYGMRQILYIYLVGLFVAFVAEDKVDPLLLADAKVRGTQITHLFFAGVYAFPMLGAILADRLFGKYKVIMWVSLIYVAGHGALAIAGRIGSQGNLGLAAPIVYLGLALIAVGSGGIKPCVSANVGDQFTTANGHLVSKIFQIFYFIINFGSFFATVITPLLMVWKGPEVAFLVPGIVMLIATVVFYLGRNRFVKVPAQPGGTTGALDFVSATLFFLPFALFAFMKDIVHDQIGRLTLTGDQVATMAQKAVAAAEGATLTAEQTAANKALLLAQAGIDGPLWTNTWLFIAIVGSISVIAGFALFSARQKRQQDDGFLAMLVYAIRNQKLRKPGDGYFGPVREKFGVEAAEGPPAVLRLMLVFSMVSVFWALFDQHSSTWVEQAKHMERAFTMPLWIWTFFAIPATIGMAIFGAIWLFCWISNHALPKVATQAVVGAVALWGLAMVIAQFVVGGTTDLKLEPAQIASLNPLMVMLIIPVLNAVVYNPMEKRGKPLKPLVRMTIGMFMAASAFATVALIQARITSLNPSGDAKGPMISVMWQVIPFLLMTASEVLVSVTGLEFAYTQAPRRMKSTLQGFWLLCVSIGNLLDVVLAPLEKTLAPAQFFWTFAGLMAGAALVFAFLASMYKGKSQLQDAAPAH